MTDCITRPSLTGPLWSDREEAEHQWTLSRVASEDAAERAHCRARAEALSVQVHGPLTNGETRMRHEDAVERRLRADAQCERASWKDLYREPARRVRAPVELYEALAWSSEVERRRR